jgi:hypothetical protein
MPPLVAKCITYLRRAERWEEAESIVDLFKTSLINDKEFLSQWALLELRQDGREIAEELGTDAAIRLIQQENLITAVRLLEKMGRVEEVTRVLDIELRSAISERDMPRIADLWRLFERFGEGDVFERTIRQRFSAEEAEILLRRGRGFKGGRYAIRGLTHESDPRSVWP